MFSYNEIVADLPIELLKKKGLQLTEIRCVCVFAAKFPLLLLTVKYWYHEGKGGGRATSLRRPYAQAVVDVIEKCRKWSLISSHTTLQNASASKHIGSSTLNFNCPSRRAGQQ